MRGLESPSYGPRPRQQKSTDPFLPYLPGHLAADPGLTAVRLWREPRDLGYAVKRTVRVGFSRLIWTRFVIHQDCRRFDEHIQRGLRRPEFLSSARDRQLAKCAQSVVKAAA